MTFFGRWSILMSQESPWVSEFFCRVNIWSNTIVKSLAQQGLAKVSYGPIVECKEVDLVCCGWKEFNMLSLLICFHLQSIRQLKNIWKCIFCGKLVGGIYLFIECSAGRCNAIPFSTRCKPGRTWRAHLSSRFNQSVKPGKVQLQLNLSQNKELALMVTKLTNNKQPYWNGYSLILITDPETKSSTLSKNSNKVIKDELNRAIHGCLRWHKAHLSFLSSFWLVCCCAQ